MKILFNSDNLSKRFQLNWIDAGKGFVTAALTSLIYFISNSLDAGTFIMDWKKFTMIFFAGGFGYLVKNFFSSPPK